VKDGVGYITLEDARITGADLAQLIAKIPATSVHVIVDACASYFLAYSRGPGGERRSLRGFQDAAELAALPRVGLLLSTSSARESHEWDAFESGVFSHEVRSGLYGAADADGDGTVSYREIAAFVARANAAVPNERFRPDVYVRPPPAGSETLVDLRRGLARRLDVDGAHAAHYYLEDTRGVRIADFHNAVGQSVHLVKPAPNGAVYLRRVDDDREFDVPAAPDVVSIAELSSAAPRVASRGAAHDAFNTLFTLPFGRAVVEAYRAAPPPSAPPAPSRETTAPSTASATRRRIGWSLAAGGAATVGVGAAFAVIAKAAHDGGSATEPQLDTELRNERIRTSNVIATAAFGVGVAAVTTGAVLILWPRARGVTASIAPSAAVVGYGGSF
jgi:hypothetical protein